MTNIVEKYCIIDKDEPTFIIRGDIYDSYDEAFKYKDKAAYIIVTVYEAIDKIKEFMFEQGYDSGKNFLKD